MLKLLMIFTLFSTTTFSQTADWIRKPKSAWPQIAMINEVWYKNGERYVDPSVEYAGTGFLIDTGTDTLAATVKHALWVAKTRSMNTVDFEDGLRRWIMHPKGNPRDSVAIDHLINTDSTEVLSGPASTITQRDWIVFTTRYVSPNIQPLKPRYSTVRKGEKILIFSCPYRETSCITLQSEVLEVEGNRIIFSIPQPANLAGASGSAVVDSNGYVIGIFSGSSYSRSTKENAFYAISTRYLKQILANEKPLNVPLIGVDEVLKQVIDKKGVAAGLKKFRAMKQKNANFFIYDFSIVKLNDLADQFLKEKQIDTAIAIFQLSIEEAPWTGTYIRLGDAYLQKGEISMARKTFQVALRLDPENEEAASRLKQIADK